MDDTPGYIAANRAMWDEAASEYAVQGRRLWREDPQWGLFGIPEAEVGVLPARLSGRRVLEAGCGTGYVSAWLTRLGARCVGLDNSSNQLATARSIQAEHDLEFPLIHGVGEQLPFRDGTFDIVISEYGASLWADPHRWIPEAARVLKPGGELIFLSNSPFVVLFMDDNEDVPAGRELRRDYFGMHRQEWPDGPGVEFHLTHGDWFKRLHASGFDVENLIELRPPVDATTHYTWVTTAWARRWPVEEVWKGRKRAR